MTIDKSFNLGTYFSAYKQQLDIECAYFSDTITHNGEKGRLNESHFVQILRRYLPKRFGIGTGFVASTNPNMRKSPQCDIIIYDTTNNAPLYESPAFAIYPIEMVYGIIEVKTDLSSEIEDCFDKCAKLRKLAHEIIPRGSFNELKADGRKDIFLENEVCTIGYKSYLRHMLDESGVPRMFRIPDKLAPRFFVFAYRGYNDAQKLELNFKQATLRHDDAHVHGMCVLSDEGGYLCRHLAHRPASERVDKVLDRDGFMTFLLSLPQMLDSMLPAWPSRIGNGFDMVDLERYNIHVTVEEVLSSAGSTRPDRSYRTR